MYRLTVDNVEHYLVVMRHVFSQKLKIHTKYKLKGSTVDREASQKERAKDTPTYKDNDFLQDGIKIAIGPEAKKTVLETLNADVGFLSKIHNMGYSLILGVHNIGMYVCNLREFYDDLMYGWKRYANISRIRKKITA